MMKKRTRQPHSAAPANRPGMRAIALVLLAAFLLSLVPLYTAARFSFAGVDDYRYGASTRAVWAQTGSLIKTVAQAARVAGEIYKSWQGSLSAIFLMALEPGVFSDGAYWLSTAFLLTTLALSLLAFLFTLCRRVFQMGVWESLATSSVSALCCVQFVPTPVESYYWFNGGVYYTFYFGLSLLAATLLIRRRAKRTVAQWVLLVLLTLLIGTGNLVTGLLCCVALTLYAAWAYFLKKERDPAVLVALLLLFAAFAINAFSPGNGVRKLEHQDRMQEAFPAILAAMRDGARYSLRWLGGPAGLVLAAFTPLFWRAVEHAPFRFRFPPLVSAASFLLLSAGFAPNEYAQSFAGEARVIDIQFYLFVLLLLVNLIWYVGWLRLHSRLSAHTLRRAACVILAVGTLTAGLTALKTRQVAAVSAVRLQLNGSGQAYAKTWASRFAALHDPAKPCVVLEKCKRQPPLLCVVDIAAETSGTHYWYNEQLAAYFGKEQVLREP